MDETTYDKENHSKRPTRPNSATEQETVQYREAALKQYELPEVSVSIFTVLGYATPLEMGIQLLGSIMAIAGGLDLLSFIDFAGAALPLMTILLGSFVNLFGSFVSPLTPSLIPPASPQAFNQEVILITCLLMEGEPTCA